MTLITVWRMMRASAATSQTSVFMTRLATAGGDAGQFSQECISVALPSGMLAPLG